MNRFNYMDYHELAFIYISRLRKRQIHHELVEFPRSLRNNFILSRFSAGAIYGPDEAWPIMKELLLLLENEMEKKLSSRSSMYWFHLYRRIGVELSPFHEDKTDSVTTGLVREIVELSILKYSKTSSLSEFFPINKMSPDSVLGGWMKRGFLSVYKDAGKNKWKSYSQQLRKHDGLVIRDFTVRDIERIYGVEGISYQYWRITALMRALGKGARIRITKIGDWDYVPGSISPNLIASFDARASAPGGFSSLSGLWVPFEHVADDAGDRLNLNRLPVPEYNINKYVFKEGIDFPSFSFPPNFRPNFITKSLNVNSFLESHAVMAEPFFKANDFSLENFIVVISALSSLVAIPSRVLSHNDEDLRGLDLSNSSLHYIRRGYGIISAKYTELEDIIRNRIDNLGLSAPDDSQLKSIIKRVVLTEESKLKIGVWSGGPRPLIIPGVDYHLFDPVGLTRLLRTLFAFMKHDDTKRGYAFEDIFRVALANLGFDVISGVKENQYGGKREIDAAVKLNGKLYLFECFSMEKPLDFEIGNPKTFMYRNGKFLEKFLQVESARDFFLEHKVGKNYDFSDCDDIQHVVVSPFIEWIWSSESRFWITKSIPRILNPNECFRLLGCKEDLHAPEELTLESSLQIGV